MIRTNSVNASIKQVKNLNGTINRVSDYTRLANKPQIENVVLEGNKTLQDLGISEISNQEILEIAKNILFTEGI